MSIPTTVGEWIAVFPNGIQKKMLANNSQQNKSDVLDKRCDSPRKALDLAFLWANTPEKHSYWNDIYVRLTNDATSIDPACEIVIPDASTTSHKPLAVSTAKEPTKKMKNANYSVSKLIIKANAELKANKEALAAHAANCAIRKSVSEAAKKAIDAIFAKEFTVKLEDGFKVEIMSISINLTGPVTPSPVDNVAKLESCIRDLEAFSDNSVGWNEDIEFILRDFSKDNRDGQAPSDGSECLTVVAPKPKQNV